MSLHINRFIDKIKMLESKKSQTFSMSIRDAKDLHSDITKLLLAVQELQTKAEETNEVQVVEISGGGFNK